MADPMLLDDNGLLEAINNGQIAQRAREHYASVESYQGRLQTRIRKLHHYYSPLNGDHWPEDAVQRPGKIHMTVNMCKPAVDVDARLQALEPRISCESDSPDQKDRLSAEAAEKVMQTFLELSVWDVWLADLTKVKCAYGFDVVKVFWNKKQDRPDVKPLENPAHLRIGWGASDFSVIDWTIYESKMSPLQVMTQYPDVVVSKLENGELRVDLRGSGDRTDPLDLAPAPLDRPQFNDRPPNYQETDYESHHVTQWDYWFKDAKGGIWNAIIIGRNVVAKVALHTELPDIPYVVIENDHEMGVPWGVATHEALIDLNYEYNRAISHAAQIINDEIDPAWQITGDNADSVPDGLIPKAGEAIAVGAGNKIELIPKSVNFPPIVTLLQHIKDDYHDVSGLPRILFGQSPGSQTTGRALSVQVEAAANRLDFKRRRLYAGLVEILNFWQFMLQKQKPRTVGKAVSGYRRWKIVAPEITPKDVIEATTNAINQVQAKIISLDTARDILGYDSPEDEGKKVIEERGNVDLFPGDVQVKTAVLAALQSIQQNQAAAAAAQGQSAQGALSNQNQQAQPTNGQAENDGAAKPATLQGSPAPAGGPTPGQTTQTTLIRPNLATGQASPLEQLASQRRI